MTAQESERFKKQLETLDVFIKELSEYVDCHRKQLFAIDESANLDIQVEAIKKVGVKVTSDLREFQT